MSAHEAETTAGFRPLKLRARDSEDLQTIAAHLQDALVPLSDMTYLKAEKRFVFVANRFRWEMVGPEDGAAPAASKPEGDARFADVDEEPAAGRLYERVNCGVCFDRVRGVRVRGVDPRDRDQILNLLTLEAGPGAITLVFSGGAQIRLDVSQIRCHIEDLGEPWPTRWRPGHDADEAVANEPR